MRPLLGLLVVVLAASGSVSGAPAAVPPGWRELPALAGASGSADQPAGVVRVEMRRGFGDPAAGCFALFQKVSAPAAGFDVEVALRSFTAGLASRGLSVKRRGGAVELVAGGFEGRVRTVASLTGERATADSVACFYNQREPERCRARCDAMLAESGGTP